MSNKELLLGPMPQQPMKLLDEAVIEAIGSEREAVRMCLLHSKIKWTQEGIADEMGLSESTISRYLSGSRHMSPARIAKFQKLCGNYAISQWTAYLSGARLVPRQLSDEEIKEQRKAALLAELQQLEDAA